MLSGFGRDLLQGSAGDWQPVEMLLERRHLIRQQVKPASVGGQLDVADFPSSTGEPLLAGSVGADRIQVGETVRFGYVPDPVAPVPPTAFPARSANPGAVPR